MAKSKAVEPPVQRKYEEVEMPDAAEAVGLSFVEVANEVAELVAERRRLDEQISERYTVMRAFMEEVDDSKSWSVRGDGWSASYIRPKPRKTLVKELLIQQGVTMKQIQKATKETEVKPYVKINLPGESD